MHISKGGAYVAGIVSVLVIGGGTAVATNGASLIVGSGNVSTTTTGLVNSKGTPLSLAGKKGTPPLKVNNTVKVKNLNSDLLDGKDSKAFLPAGAKAADSNKLNGAPASSYINNVYLAQTFSLNGQHPKPDNSVMDSLAVPAGTYQVAFNAEINNPDAGYAEYGCQLNFISGVTNTQGFYGSTLVSATTGYGAATVNQVVTFAGATTIQASCHTKLGNASNAATAYNSTLTANQIHALTGTASTSSQLLGKSKGSSAP